MSDQNSTRPAIYFQSPDAITPSKLQAWRLLSESELEALKAERPKMDYVYDVLNQMVWIRRYEQEISKCWGKINQFTVESRLDFEAASDGANGQVAE